MEEHAVTFQVADRREPPLLSLVLGFGAVLPFVVGAALAWLITGFWQELAVDATVLWGCSILTFLGGVRRGVSFRTPGGPTAGQIIATLWLYLIGLAALAVFVLGAATVQPGRTIATLLVLVVGYASLIVIDPASAKRGEVPLFFRRLRPAQMLIATASLVALLLRRLLG